MSFIHLIAKACDIDPASDEFPNILYSYSLKDEKTGTVMCTCSVH